MDSWIWAVLGFLAVLLLGNAGKSRKKDDQSADARRIDHPHYMDPDEYECPECGARFRKNVMTCPKCGKQFAGTREDDGEFLEEMDFWEEDEDD